MSQYNYDPITTYLIFLFISQILRNHLGSRNFEMNNLHSLTLIVLKSHWLDGSAQYTGSTNLTNAGLLMNQPLSRIMGIDSNPIHIYYYVIV